MVVAKAAGGLGMPRRTASTIRGMSSCVRTVELVEGSMDGEGISAEIEGLALFASVVVDFRDTLRRPRGEVLVVEADAFGAAAALVTLDEREGALVLAVFFVRPINLIIN